MEVKQIENFKIPNAVAHEITQEELQREYDFYMAQKMLETMFMFGMISVDEFHKISAVNRKTFSMSSPEYTDLKSPAGIDPLK